MPLIVPVGASNTSSRLPNREGQGKGKSMNERDMREREGEFLSASLISFVIFWV